MNNHEEDVDQDILLEDRDIQHISVEPDICHVDLLEKLMEKEAAETPLVEKKRLESETYLLIYKFLKSGPCKNAASSLGEELFGNKLLPFGVNFEGVEFQKTLDHLMNLHSRIPDDQLNIMLDQYKRLVNSHRDKVKVTSFLNDVKYPLKDPPIEAIRVGGLFEQTMINNCNLILPCTRNQRQSNILDIVRASEISGGYNTSLVHQPTMLYSKLYLQYRATGHLAAIYCLIFDFTCSRVITGADDYLVKIWCLDTAILVFTLRGHKEPISDLAIDPRNVILASGSCDKMIRIWQLSTGATIAILNGHCSMISILKFSPPNIDGIGYLSSTGCDASICFWAFNCETYIFDPKVIKYVERSKAGVHILCQSYSFGGSFLAAGSSDHVVRIYTFMEGTPVKECELLEHADKVDTVEFAHRKMEFVSGSQDGTALVWNYTCGKWDYKMLPLPESTRSQIIKVCVLAWTKDDVYILAATNNSLITIVESTTLTVVNSLSQHTDQVFVLETHPIHSNLLLTAGHEGQIIVWDIYRQDTALYSFENVTEGHGKCAIFDAKWSPDGKKINAVDSHGHVLFFGFGLNDFTNVPKEQFFHTDFRPLLRDINGFALDQQTRKQPHLMPPAFLVNAEGHPHSLAAQKMIPGREFLSDLDNRPEFSINSEGFTEVSSFPRNGEIAIRVNPEEEINIENVYFNLLEEPNPEMALNRTRIHQDYRSIRTRIPVCQMPTENVLDFDSKHIIYIIPEREYRLKCRQVENFKILEEELYSNEQAKFAHMKESDVEDQYEGPMRLRDRRKMNMAESVLDGPILSDSDNVVPVQRDVPRRTTRISNRNLFSEEADEDNSESASQSESRRPTRRRIQVVRRTSSRINLLQTRSHNLRTERLNRRNGYQEEEIVESSHDSESNSTDDSEIEQINAINEDEYEGVFQSIEVISADDEQEVEEEVVISASNVIPTCYTPPEWTRYTQQTRTPYIPQINDIVIFYKDGYENYIDQVKSCKIYIFPQTALPNSWNEPISDFVCAKVVNIQYRVLPPLVMTIRLSTIDQYTLAYKGTHFTVNYHDMPGVVDFMIPKIIYDLSTRKRWRRGDKFRCLIGKYWYNGAILSSSFNTNLYQSLEIVWDSGEAEKLSPWDIEILIRDRFPKRHGEGYLASEDEMKCMHANHAFKSLSSEYGSVYKNVVARSIQSVINNARAQNFIYPVDIQVYPLYAVHVPYMMDLELILERLKGDYYRHSSTLFHDINLIYFNAVLFNQPGSEIVDDAQFIKNMLIEKMSRLQLTHSQSTEENSLDDSSDISQENVPMNDEIKYLCINLIGEIMDMPDAAPFIEDVDLELYPNYSNYVETPMCLNTIMEKLELDAYPTIDDFANDMELVSSNSIVFNTNKRSQIYVMTLRFSASFQQLFSRLKKSIPKKRVLRNRTTSKTPNNNDSDAGPAPKPENESSTCYKRKLRSSNGMNNTTITTCSPHNSQSPKYTLRKRKRVSYISPKD